ncbi:MAG: NAD-dependent dehydratase, partial [Silvibacterium sp.]
MSGLQRTVLVAGAQGVTGLAAAQLYSSLPNTRVYGLSRRVIEDLAGVVPIQVDLLSPLDVERVIAPLNDV